LQLKEKKEWIKHKPFSSISPLKLKMPPPFFSLTGASLLTE